MAANMLASTDALQDAGVEPQRLPNWERCAANQQIKLQRSLGRAGIARRCRRRLPVEELVQHNTERKVGKFDDQRRVNLRSRVLSRPSRKIYGKSRLALERGGRDDNRFAHDGVEPGHTRTRA